MTGKTTLFPPDKTLGINKIVDGAANTLLAVEAKRDIPWTKPEDLSYAADKPLPELGGFDPNGFCVVFADTSACFIERSKIDDATILRMDHTRRQGKSETPGLNGPGDRAVEKFPTIAC